jgi:hypothetical protein
MLQYKIEPNYNAVNHFFLCALAIAAQGKLVLESMSGASEYLHSGSGNLSVSPVALVLNQRQANGLELSWTRLSDTSIYLMT